MTFAVVDLLSVRRIVSPITASLPQRRTGRMTITPEGVSAPTISVPYAPRQVEHDNLGADFAVIPRPGLKSIVAYSNEKLPTMSFTLFISDKPSSQSVSPQSSFQSVTTAISVINALKTYAEKGYRLRVSYGQMESGLWYITEFRLTSLSRDEFTDEITQAEAEITLTKDSGVAIGLGPVTGGVKPPSTPSAPTPPTQKAARYYTVKKGDTLWAISVKYYGTGTKWRTIADANGIRDPKKLKIGAVLRIP